MSPKVSILMPNFNKGSYINWAIRSVLGQTMSDFELIVVDDASTDSSVKTVREFQAQDSRIKLIVHQTNLGISRSINDGLKSSNSNFVTFLGSDDLLAPNRLQSQISAIENSSRPVVAYSDAVVIDEATKILADSKIKKVSGPCGDIIGALLAGIPSFHGALITLPRICFERVGTFDETLGWGEDYEMCLRLAKFYPFVYVTSASYGYRIYHGNTLTRITRSQRYRFQASIIEKHLALNSSTLDRETKNLVLKNLFSCYAGSRQWVKMLGHAFRNTYGFYLLISMPFRSQKIRSAFQVGSKE